MTVQRLLDFVREAEDKILFFALVIRLGVKSIRNGIVGLTNIELVSGPFIVVIGIIKVFGIVVGSVANVVLHFEGLTGITMAFPLEVMVHPDRSQDFLLGRDFTKSEAKSFETNSRMYLTQNPDKLEGSVHDLIRKKLLCEVPLLNKGTKAKYVATNTMLIITQFSSISATCTMQKSPTQDNKLPLATVGSTTYEVLNSTYPKIKTAKMLYLFN